MCLDWKVFPACPGERKVSRWGRSVAAIARGVCLCQRVSIVDEVRAVCLNCCCFCGTWGKSHVRLAYRYYANTETYLKAVALKRMPPNLQTVDMLKAGKISFFYMLPHRLSFYSFSLGWPTPEILLLAMRWQMVSFALTFSLTVTLNPMYSNVIPVLEPCLDSFVFLRVKERQENILVEPETDDQRYASSKFHLNGCHCFQPHTRWQCYLFTFCIFLHRHWNNWYYLYSVSSIREYVVDLEEGSQHLMRYRTIAPLVSSGAVQLIWMSR